YCGRGGAARRPWSTTGPARGRPADYSCGLLLRAGCARGRATGRFSVLPLPLTELADGFGREAALPALEPGSRAGFTPVLRWVPGSPRPRNGTSGDSAASGADSPGGDETAVPD